MAEPYFGSSNSNGNMQMDYISLSLCTIYYRELA